MLTENKKIKKFWKRAGPGAAPWLPGGGCKHGKHGNCRLIHEFPKDYCKRNERHAHNISA